MDEWIARCPICAYDIPWFFPWPLPGPCSLSLQHPCDGLIQYQSHSSIFFAHAVQYFISAAHTCMKGIFEATEVSKPTTFIVLNCVKRSSVVFVKM